MKNPINTLCAVAALFSVFHWNGGAVAQTPEPKTLKLGVLQSLTGIAAEFGKTAVQSITLAVEAVNKSGKVKIEMLLEDDRSDAKDTVSGYQRLKAANVDAVIGATWDFTSEPLLPLVAHDKMVLFNGTANPETLHLKESEGFAFTTMIPMVNLSQPFVPFIQNHGGRKIFYLYANNLWGEAQLRIHQDLSATTQAHTIGSQVSSNYDDNEWASQVIRIKQMRPDITALLLNKGDIELFLKRAKELHLESRFYASPGAYDAFRLSSAKDLFEGVCFSYPYAALRKHEQFVKLYKSRFKEEPRIGADSSYDAVLLLAAAFEKSQSGGEPLKAALIGLKKISGLAGEYQYKEGTTFSIGTAALHCIKGGAVVEGD